MGPSEQDGPSISFSYTIDSFVQQLGETPIHAESQESIPVSAFSHHASTFQAICRYLVDTRKLTYTQAAKLLGRSPKTIWSAYHQTTPLPPLEQSIPIPLSVFTSAKAPLEALVSHLKHQGLRNIEIAQLLKLDPKTTWTAAKRAEAKS